ncbi:MAG: C-GCAxxG-C-C family protein [Paludibacteraceae bacterium]|nr:C-GCAxxG-C-C family protein [Paludibacteraceae bacterium]
MTTNEIESRVAKAQELFKQGFNCSQSVFAACADLYGITDKTLALRLSASFGGGIGRMRLTCGAACGMFLLAGLESGSSTPGDAEGKKRNYELVQRLAADFKAEHGSITCADLLGLTSAANPTPLHLYSSTPSERTTEYYHKRPCVEMVGDAVRIYLTRLNERETLE